MFRYGFESWFYRLEEFRLYLHFSWVIRQLSLPGRDIVSPQIISQIDGYRNRRVFPRNNGCATVTPVFIDTEQRACAVADLLIHSGCSHQAITIAAKNNYALIVAMDFDMLRPWAKQHGLSRQDLALIQPQYFQVSSLGLLLLLLSCANLFFVLFWGRQHFVNTLIGIALCVLLLSVGWLGF